MTGSRLVGTIVNEMQRRKARYGVVTMCVGGGQGAAALFETGVTMTTCRCVGAKVRRFLGAVLRCYVLGASCTA